MVLFPDLTRAADKGVTFVIEEWFLTGRRDPNEIDKRGQTLLLIASLSNRIEIMRVLLAHGANVASVNLHAVTYMGHYAAVVLLLEHGAQVDERATDGKTPLFVAAFNRAAGCDMVRLLLHYGADLDARDNNGKNADFSAHILDQGRNSGNTIALLADIRRAGGWLGYLRYPRFRLLKLRILAEQGRAETQDALLRRLFPAGPPAPEGTKRPREAYRAQKGGRLPRSINH